MASIHCLGFPHGTLTSMGTPCIKKYYRWHMEGKHAIATFGLELQGVVIGYCVLLSHNQFSGFLLRALPIILRRLARTPSLAIKPGFGRQLRGGLSLLLRLGTARPQPNTLRILAIAIHPSFQGRGFAQLLLTAAAGVAISHGASALALSVHPENERALRAYARDGWERVAVNGKWKGLMRKSLLQDSRKPLTTPVL
jgi:ribosomal protein S18 acetylase RimI-like enzyme